MKQMTVAIDVDGIIRNHFGELNDNAIPALEWIESKGHKIILMTACKDFAGTKQWLRKYRIGYELYKKPPATMYFDDRAIRFNGWNDLT